MLQLTRRVGQAIVINRDITVRVRSLTANRVRLQIEAPEDIPVNRAEVEARGVPELKQAGTGE